MGFSENRSRFGREKCVLASGIRVKDGRTWACCSDWLGLPRRSKATNRPREKPQQMVVSIVRESPPEKNARNIQAFTLWKINPWKLQKWRIGSDDLSFQTGDDFRFLSPLGCSPSYRFRRRSIGVIAPFIAGRPRCRTFEDSKNKCRTVKKFKNYIPTNFRLFTVIFKWILP